MPKPRTTPSRKSKRVTVHDVAKEAGVSIATVSYTLNDSGSISDEIRKKVRKAAKKLGYRQNRAARAMKIGRSDIIGLVIPNIENPFFATLAQAVLLECQRRDLQVFLLDTEGSHESETKAMQGLVQQGVDGIIVFPIDDSDLGAGGAVDVPVVVLDRDSVDRDVVQAEFAEGGRLLAEHLLSLGHKRFGLLEGPQLAVSARQRSEGFIDAVGTNGKIVWRYEHPFELTLTEQAKKLLKKGDVTAIFCGNDLIAMGAMHHLQEQGVAIPEKISVVGFDDIQFSGIVSPALTTVRMPIAQMGVEAVNLLARRLRDVEKIGSRSKVILDVELVVRASSGPA
jgi:LacI family transcriptional regulator